MRTTSLLGLLLFPALVACGAAEKSSEPGPLGRQSSAVQGGKTDTRTAHNFAVGIANIRHGAICSGTLIAPNLVLTARHCVVPPESSASVTCDDEFPTRNVDPSTLLITTTPRLDPDSKLYRAQEITTPADRGFCGNDIALITLGENIPESEAVPATPVVQFSMTDRSKIGGQITALGYGITSPSARDSGVRRIRQDIDILCVPGDDSYDCKSGYAQLLESPKEFITEGYVCSGDSGGGAFDQESFANGAPYVLGALSRGPESEDTCLAAIYTRTDAHADMIIATGKKAAQAGGYTDPEWVTPAAVEDTELEAACEGETCTPTDDAAEPAAPPAIRKTTTGCSATPGKASSGSSGVLALLGLFALVVTRRRRAA